ncbi:hypothetical protein V6R21_28615 [Limibacter armeniacum]|uniref:hypothetical protein n=1 Tax=Limibacter armeniacum TaxID=466084 RepID=UPI002FE679E7
MNHFTRERIHQRILQKKRINTTYETGLILYVMFSSSIFIYLTYQIKQKLTAVSIQLLTANAHWALWTTALFTISIAIVYFFAQKDRILPIKISSGAGIALSIASVCIHFGYLRQLFEMGNSWDSSMIYMMLLSGLYLVQLSLVVPASIFLCSETFKYRVHSKSLTFSRNLVIFSLYKTALWIYILFFTFSLS